LRDELEAARRRIVDSELAGASKGSAGDRLNAATVEVTEQVIAELDNMVAAFANAIPQLPALIRHNDLASLLRGAADCLFVRPETARHGRDAENAEERQVQHCEMTGDDRESEKERGRGFSLINRSGEEKTPGAGDLLLGSDNVVNAI
jgi:hypothetical protein